MRLQWAILMLAGSIAVHGVVTACSPTSKANADTNTNTNTNTNANANTSGGSGDTAAAEVADEQCVQAYEVPNPEIRFPGLTDAAAGPPPAMETVHFAEHAYPGKTKAEIAAHVTTWTDIISTPDVERPPVYIGGFNLQTAVFARDGFAGAGCSDGTVTHFVWSP